MLLGDVESHNLRNRCHNRTWQTQSRRRRRHILHRNPNRRCYHTFPKKKRASSEELLAALENIVARDSDPSLPESLTKRRSTCTARPDHETGAQNHQGTLEQDALEFCGCRCGCCGSQPGSASPGCATHERSTVGTRQTRPTWNGRPSRQYCRDTAVVGTLHVCTKHELGSHVIWSI